MFNGLTSIVYKEVFHILRDFKTLFLMLLVPGMDLIMFGYAIDLNVENVQTVIYNLDGRRESRELIEAFENSRSFEIAGFVFSDEELQERIVAGDAKVGIKIPPHYSDDVLRGVSTSIQILIDGSDSVVAMQSLNVANAIALQKSVEVFSEIVPGAKAMPVEARPRVLFNPDMETANFMIPGLVGVVMQLVTMLLTALSIVREKENGTLEQLMVTPVSRLGLMIGKLFPYAIIGAFETALVVAIMRFWFQVPITGSLTLLALFSIPFLITSLAVGLLISVLAQNQMQAVQLSFVFILPSILLSGFMFPQETMPPIIYAMGQTIPATYFLRILRGIILRGAGFAELWDQAAILLAMGMAFLLVAASQFKKTLG